MSKLEALMAEMCPEGVEYVKLKDVAQISAGGDLPDNYIKGQKVPTEQFPYPIYSNGTEDGALYGFTDSYKIEKEAVTISARGTIGYHAVRAGKFTPIVRLITMIADESKITTKFLHYALYVAGISGVTTGIPSLTVPMLEKFTIPLPPLPVQGEIVRILDNFTELTAELTAELSARKKQYEYYSKELLSFRDAQYYALADLCDIVDYRGKTPKKVENGVFLVTAKNIRKGYIDYEKSKEYIAPEDYEIVMRRGYPQQGDVLITTEAPCGNVAQIDKEGIALAQRVIKYRPKTDALNSTFLKYILLGNEFQDKLLATATGGTVKGIKGSKLHKLTIPVPPLEVQARIVAILDRFDTLCNDLTSGLPAEIEARRQQYEYYRDQLLTFPARADGEMEVGV